MAPRFLGLPMELKLKILEYSMVLDELVYQQGVMEIKWKEEVEDTDGVANAADGLTTCRAPVENCYIRVPYNSLEGFELQHVQASGQILAVCKELHFLGLTILYGRNEFVIREIHDLIGMKSAIGAQALDRITTFTIRPIPDISSIRSHLDKVFPRHKASRVLENASRKLWLYTLDETEFEDEIRDILTDMTCLKGVEIDMPFDITQSQTPSSDRCHAYITRVFQRELSRPSWLSDVVKQTSFQGVQWSVSMMWMDTKRCFERGVRVKPKWPLLSMSWADSVTFTVEGCQQMTRIHFNVSCRDLRGYDELLTELIVHKDDNEKIVVEERTVVSNAWTEWRVVEELDAGGIF